MPDSTIVGTPVTDVATSTAGDRVRWSWYAERPVTGPAGHLIAYVWCGVPGWRRRIRLLPDGCVDLVWDGATITVAPPAARATRIALEPGGLTTGVRLLPHAAVTILGRPAPRLDSPTPLGDLWPPGTADRLAEALHDSSPHAVSTRLIQAVHEHARHPRFRPDPRVAAFVERLTDPGATVEAAARSIGTSSRTIRRHVRDDTTLAPKSLHEILRFRRALTAMSASGLAQAAIDAGYCDQAHLNRQVRKLTGTTPTALAST
jgi:AraC-like DNA-binding protein